MKRDLTKLKPLTVTDSFGKNKATIDYAAIKGASLTLRALYHPLRRELLELIQANGKMIVTDIYKKLKMEQSVASQQLGIMRKAGIVIATRDGKRIYYSINAKWIGQVLPLAAEMWFEKGK